MFDSRSKAFRWTVITAVVQQLENMKRLHVDDLEVPDFGDLDEDWQGEIESAIQDLLWSGELESVDGSIFELSHDAFMELRALYYDSRVRHGISGSHMVDFLMQFMDQSN